MKSTTPLLGVGKLSRRYGSLAEGNTIPNAKSQGREMDSSGEVPA
jgi:hypothetical protein